jgi:hypothetical protein
MCYVQIDGGCERNLLSTPCCQGYLHTACTQKMAMVSGKLAFRYIFFLVCMLSVVRNN